ncbi:MAG: hypothetical protein EB127_21420 [Alphaproteobacteria bacterium]|jgi:hypothetical protein|nr:hypothetical protein [Alphaproteobacteria bacterium]
MNNTFELNYDSAHSFVEKNANVGFFWNGWDIVKWSPGSGGYMEVNGMFRNGKWGYASTYKMTQKGTWRLSNKYAQLT